MSGTLKTEAIVLRSLRYGEADRILHLYTRDRGRVSAMAKGVRRTRTRFGGRLEPFFRLDMVLYEGRSELLTVTSAETVAPHARLREHAGALDAAARACDAVARLFETGEPHPPAPPPPPPPPPLRDRRAPPARLPPPGQRARAARRAARQGRRRERAGLPPEAPRRGRPRAPARELRRPRGRGAPHELLRRRRRRGVRRLRGGGLPHGAGHPRL